MASRQQTPDEQDLSLPPEVLAALDDHLLPERVAAAQHLMVEGVEFEQFQRHLLTRLSDEYGVMFGRGGGSAWYAKRHGLKIVPPKGEKDYWLSLADLLLDVFALIQDEQP